MDFGWTEQIFLEGFHIKECIDTNEKNQFFMHGPYLFRNDTWRCGESLLYHDHASCSHCFSPFCLASFSNFIYFILSYVKEVFVHIPYSRYPKTGVVQTQSLGGIMV